MVRKRPSLLLSAICLAVLLAGTIGLAGCGGGGGVAGGVTGGVTEDPTPPDTDDPPPANNIQMGGAIQGTPLSLAGVSSTLAGVPPVSSQDGTGAAARFTQPRGVTSDGTNLFVADTYNHTIRKVEIATGVVTTIAGTAGFSGSADGAGAAARFRYPYGVAVTADGATLFVADSANHTVRKIVIATGVVTTLAGTAGSPGSVDGTGSAARFDTPRGVAADGTNLFVADTFNHTIRKIEIATGAVTTFAGSAEGFYGSTDGIGLAASFFLPSGVATDGTNLFVADTFNHTIRRVVIATAGVTTVAGTAESSGSTDGTGPAARFDRPYGVATDGANVFAVDTNNHTIRKIEIATGVVTTFAGTAGSSGFVDDTGSAARFIAPFGITADGTKLFVADTNNHTIRKAVIATGVVTTLAGAPESRGSSDGTGSAARFNGPYGITTDGTNVFVADTGNHTIRKVEIATGVVTTFAGTAGSSGSADGTGSAARLNNPFGVTTDGTNLFVADTYNHTIRKVEIATGVVTTLAGTAGSYGSADGTGSAARFFQPTGVTMDNTNLFVADSYNNTIRKVEIATGAVTTFAGTAGSSGSADGTGAAARFNAPVGVTTDGTNLFVADAGNHAIRKVEIATGAVTTVAGTAGSTGSADGTGAAARFFSPIGVTTDGTRLLVTDWYNNTVRTIY